MCAVRITGKEGASSFRELEATCAHRRQGGRPSVQSKKQREPVSTGRTEAKEALAKPDEDSEPFLYPGVCLAAAVNTRVSL